MNRAEVVKWVVGATAVVVGLSGASVGLVGIAHGQEGGVQLAQDRILCAMRQPDGRSCITIQQLPTEPVVADTGYLTQWSWQLSNVCAHPMQVTWGWQDGQVVDGIRLANGETATASCLTGINECTGKLRISYRCSQ